jgi:hypothetical protein
MRTRGPRLLALLLVLCFAPQVAAARTVSLAPLCRIGEDFTGATLAEIAWHSPNPWLIAAGGT